LPLVAVVYLVAIVPVLAALPVLLIVVAVVLEIRSHEIGFPGVAAAAVLAMVGPVRYRAMGQRGPSTG
jgi:hypothetical protein